MPRFFTEEISGGTAVVTGDDFAHISRVLRMKPGEALTVCDLKGTDHDCSILRFEADRVVLSIVESRPSMTEPSVAITLYQALPKADKMELIVQKAVELGASDVVPVLTARCVSRPDEKSMNKKLERYNKIAFEAAKQSGRGKIPRVHPVLSFEKAIRKMAEDSLALLFYEKARSPLMTLLPRRFLSVSVMVGSEGGFEEAEAAAAEEAGISLASLGPRILRCETAPIAALSALLYHSGNF